MWDWNEGVSQERRRQEELWAFASTLDVDRVRDLLESGTPPEPRLSTSVGNDSPLTRALRSPHARGAADPRQQEIVSLLLEARKAHPSLSAPASALVVSLEKGLRWALEKILPVCPEGINTRLPSTSSTPLMKAIEGLGNVSAPWPGAMSAEEVFQWVMEKGPSLDPSCLATASGVLEPLPFALVKHAEARPGSEVKHRYERAVDVLVHAGAPVWIEGASQSWRAASLIVKSQNQAWEAYLMDHFPREQWDELEARVGVGQGQARFRQLRLERELEGASPTPSRPRM